MILKVWSQDLWHQHHLGIIRNADYQPDSIPPKAESPGVEPRIVFLGDSDPGSSSETTASSIYCLQAGLHYGEGNGDPLQYSCLENPMDRGAW